MERANVAIATAVTTLGDADIQRSLAIGNHLRGIDRLLELNEGRTRDLELEFSRELVALQEEFSLERDELISRHASYRSELLHTLEALKEVEEFRQGEEQEEFEQAREALRRKALHRLNSLQSTMDSRIAKSETNFEAAHMAYLANTSYRTAEFKALTERTAYDKGIIDQQKASAELMAHNLVAWRSRVLNSARSLAERNEGLAGESSSMSRQVEHMKSEIVRKRKIHLGRLKSLSAAAAVVKSRLAEATSNAERILSLAERSRYHESLSEKVDPFALSRGGREGAGVGGLGAAPATHAASLIAEVQQEVAAAVDAGELSHTTKTATTKTMGCVLGEDGTSCENNKLGIPDSALAPGTENFLKETETMGVWYKRYNKALLECLVLTRRRDRLRAEKEELSGALQQVMDGLALTPSAVDSANSLLVINGKVAVDAGAGTAMAPNRASAALSFSASGPPATRFPVRLGGPSIVPVRPGAPGVATISVSGNAAITEQRKQLGIVGGKF